MLLTRDHMTLLAFQIKIKIIALLNVHYENVFIQKCYAPMCLFSERKTQNAV